MAGGNAIRGSRVGAGPIGEAERGESAPRLRLPFWCANGHETRIAFASDADVPVGVLLPAYITSELKTAFQIGFLLFLPFLVIDMVIASILMALGMMMLSPMIVSLPFKLLLFVLVDGWALTMGSLASSFQGAL